MFKDVRTEKYRKKWRDESQTEHKISPNQTLWLIGSYKLIIRVKRYSVAAAAASIQSC